MSESVRASAREARESYPLLLDWLPDDTCKQTVLAHITAKAHASVIMDALDDLEVENATLRKELEAATTALTDELQERDWLIATLREQIAALKAERESHPEATCQRCSRPNVWSWHAPSPLWNAVMRDPETGDDVFSVVCPPCFAEMASTKGIGASWIDGSWRMTWCFKPHDDELDVAALWKDADGRTWNAATCLWQPAPEPPPLTAAKGDEYGP